MKIIGAEGLDAPGIRAEVARGARFVLYQYCISVVVVTYRRSSNVYFLRPGQSRIVKGLPFVLISLVLGWWGFPWGPIYTLQSLVNDLLGGKDVTDEVMASIAPPARAPGPAAAPAATAPAAPAAAAGREPSPGKKFAMGAAVVVLLAAAVIGSLCYYRSTQLTVVLVAGTSRPYVIELNGARHELRQGHPVILTLPEGRYTLTGGPAGAGAPPQTYQFTLPFFSHLGKARVAVINPDRTAIVYEETTVYFPTGVTPDPAAQRTYTVYANEASYFLPRPDYVFVDFPHQVQMPRDAARATRTRLAQLAASTADEQASLLLEHRDYATMQGHLGLLAAQQPEDENLLRTAIAALKPADCRAFLNAHLADRPVLVEWHRYYQWYEELHFPEVDLAPQYRARLAAEPGDGAWLYLLGRVCPDPAETRALNERALTAPKPCYYAYNGLGVDALNRADFARALECFSAAEQKGLTSETLQHNKRLARLALGDFRGLLADAGLRRKAAPADPAAAEEEIICALRAGLGTAAAEKIKSECVAATSRAEPADSKGREQVAIYLSAAIAYGAGDAVGSGRALEKLETPVFAFRAAIDRGDHAAAAAVLKKNPEPPSTEQLLCFLAAKVTGEEPAAEAYFAKALEAMAREDRTMRLLGALLRQPAPPGFAAVNALSFSPEQKRIVMAALGWRDPGSRAAYFEWARRMNFDPAFPHLLIEQATAAPGHRP